MTHKFFIEKIAAAVKKYAPEYGIKVYSPIIAQAILESAWGESKLAGYHNYFGLKAGKGYKGKTVDFKTKEEVNGKTVTITDTFRAFDTLEDGVKGYFDFINTARYKSLKGITDPKKYLEAIKAAGYATASNYVASVYSVIEKNNLAQYDPGAIPAAQKNNKAVDDAFTTIAKDVIENVQKYGTGTVRKERIYNMVQQKINSLLR